MIESLGSAGFFAICVACFIYMIGSATIPVFNAEALLLVFSALPAVAQSRATLITLLLVATAGHMLGKTILYLAGRGGSRKVPARFNSAIAKWSKTLEHSPARAAGLVLLSSIVGLPPFYVMTLVAGALRMNFAVFIIAGSVGRLVRFGAVMFFGASLTQLVRGWFS